MIEAHKATPQQRRRALVSGLVLAALALGIYLVIVLKFYLR
ncbi:MAG TPA: hypothetical protein VN878_07580 [Usitatibacter sp.]|nr:hypothetical protein [Usitatibacter sp.]